MTPVPLTAERVVRRLSLSAPSRALLHRGRLWVEDALRTASLPHGLLLIRRLDLGRIDPRRSPAALRERAESALRELRVQALRPEARAAALAPAVWFTDALEPCRLLAEALAEGRVPTAWFWSRAVAGYTPQAPPAERLMAALRAASDSAAGPVGLSRVLDGPARRGHLAALLAPLRVADAERLWRALADGPSGGELERSVGMERAAPADRLVEDVGAEALVPAWLAPLVQLIGHWGPRDVRARWLCALALVQRRPYAVSAARLRLQAPRLAETLFAIQGEPIMTGPAPAAVSSQEPQPTRGDDFPRASSQAAPAVSERAVPPPEASPPTRETPGSPWRTATEATALAGGAFLITLLRQLGIEPWLEAQAWDGVEQVPALVLRRLLQDYEPNDALPLALFDPDRLSLEEPASGSRVERAVHIWCARVEVYLAEREELDLDTLVQRPAKLSASELHLDLFFPAWRADLRVRRRALDVDPGWVPWLARIVTFHYLDAQAYGAL